MANEVHQKAAVAEFAFDFDTVLNSLADQALAWAAPVTTCEDCDFIKVVAKITAGTSPNGSILFLAGRNGGTNNVGTDDITVTDHGSNTTVSQIDQVLGVLGSPVGSIGHMDTTGTVVTVEFKIWYPGASVNLYVFNDTGAALPSSGHEAHGYGYLPEIQG